MADDRSDWAERIGSRLIEKADLTVTDSDGTTYIVERMVNVGGTLVSVPAWTYRDEWKSRADASASAGQKQRDST